MNTESDLGDPKTCGSGGSGSGSGFGSGSATLIFPNLEGNFETIGKKSYERKGFLLYDEEMHQV